MSDNNAKCSKMVIKMNVGIVYVITAFICLLEILLILNRTRATKYKETIDIPFCRMLLLYLVFCSMDLMWGAFYSHSFGTFQLGFTVISYGFHSLAAISAYVWLGYAIQYTKAERKESVILNGLRVVLLSIQIVLLASNLVEHNAFYVDEKGYYHMGNLRTILYLIQFSYYFILLIYATYKLINAKNNRELYKRAMIFCLVPLAFGIGQYIFYDVAMYSLGFMFSAFVIYSYNVTAQREIFFEKEAERLNAAVYRDSYTGLYNRCCYEEDFKKYNKDHTKKDMVYVSMDINGLKDINDSLGHDAGDELIRNAAFCMSSCFGKYGKVYRIGGDEFAAILFLDSEKLKEIMDDFEETVSECSGQLVEHMYISCGYVTKNEFPGISFTEMAKTADKRMYEKKELFYAKMGIDRRGQQQAFHAVCRSYEKILKVNLTSGRCSIIQLDFSERSEQKGYNEDIFIWLKNLAEFEVVHKEDREYYLKHVSKEYLTNYFKEKNVWYCIYYRRLIGREYKRVMLEMVRAKEYSDDDQIVFLYVKDIGKG